LVIATFIAYPPRRAHAIHKPARFT
jgi:hypothetical protein